MNQAVTARPPLKAVAAALGSLIARRSDDEIVRQVMADFELDEATAQQCLEIARRMVQAHSS